MECFRIDESGYTGYDLLNRDQRFQGAAAIAIDNTDAERLIKEYFPRLQARELKYKALSRRPTYHCPLIELQQALLTDYKCVTYVCDKRFLLALMFLDYAVEPFYFERGFNFYENGQNYAMASLFYCTGPTLLGKEKFEALICSFQHAVKDKTHESLLELVAAARRTRWHEIPEVLRPLAQYAAPECLGAIATPGVDTDAVPVVLHSLIGRMEVLANGPYRVEHDESRKLLTYHEYFQRLIDHEERIEFRTTKETSLKFPLKLTEVKHIDSKTSAAVQMADVLIGAAIEAANNLAGLRSSGLDPQEVLSLYQDEQFISLVPDLDFESQRRLREGSQSAALIDYLGNYFTRKS